MGRLAAVPLHAAAPQLQAQTSPCNRGEFCVWVERMDATRGLGTASHARAKKVHHDSSKGKEFTAKFQVTSRHPTTSLCGLQEKLNLLERLEPFEGVQESVCMREFTRSFRVCETY